MLRLSPEASHLHFPNAQRIIRTLNNLRLIQPLAAPLGNQNAVKAKRWQQAVDRALERRSRSEGIAELDRLADVYLETIEEMTVATEKRGPSIAGFADLADRIDGKASQTIQGPGDGGEHLVDARVEVVIVDAQG